MAGMIVIQFDRNVNMSDNSYINFGFDEITAKNYNITKGS
jgi:hypothetical protein